MRVRSAPLVNGLHELVLVVHGVGGDGDAELMQVRRALDHPGALLGLGQRRQQQRREYRDDGNDYQQLDQSERPSSGFTHDHTRLDKITSPHWSDSVSH